MDQDSRPNQRAESKVIPVIPYYSLEPGHPVAVFQEQVITSVHRVVEECESINGQKVVHAIYKTPGKFLGFVNAEEHSLKMLKPVSVSAPFFIKESASAQRKFPAL